MQAIISNEASKNNYEERHVEKKKVNILDYLWIIIQEYEWRSPIAIKHLCEFLSLQFHTWLLSRDLLIVVITRKCCEESP